MKLADEKIAELAPEWATHYRITGSEVMYESSRKWMAVGLRYPCIVRGPYSQNSKLTKCKPIPRKPKPFDINQHEFGDTVCFTEISESNLRLNCDDFLNYVDLFKADAIAIAKHFGLTGEDLK